MVITAMAGSVKTEDCEKALIKMHSRIHLLEKKNPSPFGKGKGKPYSGKGKKGKTHKGAQYSYLSTVEELFDATVDDGEDYAYTADAYTADVNHEDDWVYPGGDDSYADWGEEAELVAQTADASLRDVELDVLTAFLGTEGFNSEDRESVALLTEAAQAETMAFMARSKAKGKGKPTSKSAHSYRPRPSNLSVEDRRKKLQEITRTRAHVKCAGAAGIGPETRSVPESKRLRQEAHRRHSSHRLCVLRKRELRRTPGTEKSQTPATTPTRDTAPQCRERHGPRGLHGILRRGRL